MSHIGEWNPWPKYCSDLYNNETDGDPIVLDCPQIPDKEHHPVLREEVEAAVKGLKMGNSTSRISPSRRKGHDRHPDLNLQQDLESKKISNDQELIQSDPIWKTGDWSTTWTQSLVITLQKKGKLQLCQNYRAISLISHPSKAMLKIILNRL